MSARSEAAASAGGGDTASLSSGADVRERLKVVLGSAAVVFSAVTLSTVQFVSHSLPSPHIVYTPPEVVVAAILLLIIAPFLALFVADRLIARQDEGRPQLRAFRTGVFAVAGVLVLREVQLYFGPVRLFFDAFGPMEGVVFVAAAAAIAWAVWRWYEGARRLLMHMAPVALVVLMVTFVQMLPAHAPPDHYGVATAKGDPANAPVFVIVADELAFDEIAEGDGLEGVDAELVPNFASLANDGAWVTDPTTNHVHTSFIVPEFMDSLRNVKDDYQLRLYGQYTWVEVQAWDLCGVEFTCRGALHESRENRPELVGTLARRSLFQLTPGSIESALAPATDWMQGSLRTPAPNVDHLGMHTFTNAGFEEVMEDVNDETAPGSVFFYHLLLPHTPFVFAADGSIYNSEVSGSQRGRYTEQTRYLDTLLGELVAKLKAEGLYDEATVIVTGDHGRREQSIQGVPPEEFELDVTDRVTKVPLIIKGPNVEPGIYDVDYQHMDFEATFLDALGREIPADAPGVSVFEEERPDREKVFYVDQHNDRYWTYVYDEESGEWELVDFKDEPLAPGDIGWAFEN